MQLKNGGGDKLASGAARATFRPAEGVSEEKWQSIFGDFDAERYRRNANSQSTGDAGVEPRKAKSRPTGPVA